MHFFVEFLFSSCSESGLAFFSKKKQKKKFILKGFVAIPEVLSIFTTTDVLPNQSQDHRIKIILFSTTYIFNAPHLTWRLMEMTYGPRQANLVLIAYASSEGSGEPAHPRSLARTFPARSYKQ